MAESLFTTQTPAFTNEFDGHPYTLGTVIVPAVAGQVTGGRWRFPTTLPSGSVDFVLYDENTQAQLGRATFTSPTAGAWNTVALSTPVSVTAGQRLVAAVYTPDRYVSTSGLFNTSGITNGNLTAPATGADPIGNGRFNDPNDAYPSSTFGGNAYFADLVFTASGGATVAPDGIAVPVSLGAPALSWSGSVAPAGISVPVTLGAPTVGAAGLTPDGIGVPVTLGDPTLTWSGSVSPDGISVPVALGSPSIPGALLAPDGVAVPVTLGAPDVAWSWSVSPDGIPVVMSLGAPTLSVSGGIIPRPNTGTITRPNTGVIIRTLAGVIARLSTGIIARP